MSRTLPADHAILPAAPEDADALLALQREAFRAEAALYGDFTIAPLTQTREHMIRDILGMTVLKYCIRQEIAGSVRGVLEDGVCRIGRLAVRPDRQNRGIGTLLMAAIEERFRPHCLRFEIFTGHKSEKNLSLYAALGYERSRVVPQTPGLQIVHMVKKASSPRRRPPA